MSWLYLLLAILLLGFSSWGWVSRSNWLNNQKNKNKKE